MRRQLLTFIPVLEAPLRQQICEAAESLGVEALFAETEEAAAAAAAEAEILFTQSALLARKAPKLRWLCTPSAGVDHFLPLADVFAAKGIVLTNSSGAYGVTIAEHIVMMALEMLRRQPFYADIVRNRQWVRDVPVQSLKGSRITMLGTGDLGQEAAMRLRAFGPASLTGVNRGGSNPRGLFDRVVTQKKLDEVLPDTDILIISLPGTAETTRMLDARRMAMLPDGALVINVGRGCVIDQAALEKELQACRLLAALDVFEEEPIPQEAPLWTCPNLLITPHVAGNMTLPYTRQRIVTLFLEDLKRYCAGQPLVKQVDLKRGY